MVNNSTIPAVLNLNAPLKFLSPELTGQLQVSSYVVLASLSAFVWDCIISIPEEYEIFRKCRISSMPTIAYILSRIGTLCFCVSATVFQIGSVAHCQALLYVIGGSFALGLSSTSLLFFFRVRAIYGNSRIITAFFGFMWVATLGLSGLIPHSIFGDHIGHTNRCIKTSVRSVASIPVVFNAINDTLIFLAISYHILSYAIIGDGWRARARSFFLGDGLPRLSRGLLQGGQLYYFVTIWLSIVFVTMLLVPDFPAVYHTMLSVPNLALENAMACRVYRAVKLGFITNSQSTLYGITISSVNFQKEPYHDFSFELSTLDQPQANTNIILIQDLESHMSVGNCT